MAKLKEIVDVNTIVGDPVYTEGDAVVIPVSKVSFGFFSGAADCPARGKNEKTGATMDSDGKLPFAGAAIAGVSVTPKAFLSMNEGRASVLPCEYDCTLDRLVELIPQAVAEIKLACKAAKEQNTDNGCCKHKKPEGGSANEETKTESAPTKEQ